MITPLEDNPQELEFITSAPHACGYLPDIQAATLYANPLLPMNLALYESLLAIGFRRSGPIAYRPLCPTCESCIPVRLPVQRFQTTRSMARVLKRNKDLTLHLEEPAFTEERFDLYCRYLNSRHGDGPMDHPKPEDFNEFLLASWNRVVFVDFRLEGRLLMTAVVDWLPNSLSAVYSFFDPEESTRSLGTQAILWEIQYAQQLGLNWLYLGYWIADSPKMRYKSRFQPMEALIMGQWQPMESHP